VLKEFRDASIVVDTAQRIEAAETGNEDDVATLARSRTVVGHGSRPLHDFQGRGSKTRRVGYRAAAWAVHSRIEPDHPLALRVQFGLIAERERGEDRVEGGGGDFASWAGL
jgi:hypothetical protein